MVRMISRSASTNVSTGHRPSLLVGHPRSEVSGTTPSFTMMRICGPGVEVQESTMGGVSHVEGGRKR